jgi:hypothetical protein
VIVSASIGPRKAYYVEDAESFVYRRRSDDGEMWKAISEGLLEPSEQQLPLLLQIQKLRANLFPQQSWNIYL